MSIVEDFPTDGMGLPSGGSTTGDGFAITWGRASEGDILRAVAGRLCWLQSDGNIVVPDPRVHDAIRLVVLAAESLDAYRSRERDIEIGTWVPPERSLPPLPEGSFRIGIESMATVHTSPGASTGCCKHSHGACEKCSGYAHFWTGGGGFCYRCEDCGHTKWGGLPVTEADIDPTLKGLFIHAMAEFDYGHDNSPLNPLSDYIEENGGSKHMCEMIRTGYPKSGIFDFLVSLGMKRELVYKICREWMIESNDINSRMRCIPSN